MKSTVSKDKYKEIYSRLDAVSPIEGDCGRLCGAVCCTCEQSENGEAAGLNEDDLGIYLLPGEEKIFDGPQREQMIWNTDLAENYEFPDSWHGKVFFIRCKTPPHCDRRYRPIQCRTFPAAPHYLEKGRLCLILSDSETPYTCPLISERISLTESFLKETYECWKLLCEDMLIRDLVELDSYWREYDRKKLTVIWPPEYADAE